MLEKLTIITELVSAIICIHCIYGKRVKLDIGTIVLFMILLTSLEVINQFQVQSVSSVVLYGVIGVYCRQRFKGSLIHTIINIVLFLVIFIVMQFGFVILVNLFISNYEMLRAFVVNVCVLLCSIFIIPHLHIEMLAMFINKYRMYWITGIVSIIVILILYQNKIRNGMPTEYFIVAVPILATLLVMVIKWGKVQTDKEVEEQEWALQVKEEKHYEELLEDLRIKQHAFKNHITAIFSARYAYDTYDKVVAEQDTYYGQVMEDNKYQKLLRLENKPIIGYLYGKFREIEGDGIRVEMEIMTHSVSYAIPGHILVEMLGILLDNAVEAIKGTEYTQSVYVTLSDTREEYCYTFGNEYQYVPYSELEKWFELGQSRNGKWRGIGLYHLRTLCNEWNCEVAYKNQMAEGKNRIEFSLKIPKTEG